MEDLNSKKLILLGSERSGSNLLRVLLDNHSQISAPVPVHFCDVFLPLLGRYGSLQKVGNAERLLEHMIRFSNSDFSDWRIGKTAEEFVEVYRIQSFSDAFCALYQEKAREKQKKSWFCKDNNMHRYAFPIERNLRNVRFVYLYRDPRDQVASWMRNPLFFMTPRKAVQKWVEEQGIIRQLIESWGLNPVFVKYEELVSDTGNVMQRVLEQVALPVESACFQTSAKHAEAKKFKLWENIEKPVIRDNFGKFSDVLSDDEIRVIEEKAASAMAWLGYEKKLERIKNVEKSFRYRFREKRVRRQNQAKARKDAESGEHAVLKSKRKELAGILRELESWTPVA